MRLGQIGPGRCRQGTACHRLSGSARDRASTGRPARRAERHWRFARRLRRSGCCNRGQRYLAGVRMTSQPSGAVTAAEHDAARAARLQAGQADIEPRCVGAHRACADQDGIAARAFEMRVRARGIAGDPAAAAIGHRDAAVERGCELERHMRAAFAMMRVMKPASPARASAASSSRSTIMPAASSRSKPLPAVRGSGSVSAPTTRAGLGGDQAVGTGWSTRAFMRAGLKADIDCRACRLALPACASATASAWGRPPAGSSRAR
jgi:hypothetical protein